MKVALELKARNGVLYELVQKAGSATALGKAVGVNHGTIGKWLNFQGVPDLDAPSHKARYAQIDIAFVTLYGVGLDEIFPEEIRLNARRLKEQAKHTAIVEMAAEHLIELGGAGPRLIEAPDDEILQAEAGAAIHELLKTLSPREEKVIRMRFGLDGDGEHTWREVGQELGVTASRIQQIEAKALRYLRHPDRARKLKDFVYPLAAIADKRPGTLPDDTRLI